jgi:RNA polymerase sigma-70 factor (ECF subfamily)
MGSISAFPTTRWSTVLAARDSAAPDFQIALGRLCEAYWPPLYGFVRRQGFGPEEARDLVQGYFALLLERNYLGGVCPERGRFRSFLLVSMKHFLADERDRSRARKRLPMRGLFSIDSGRAEAELDLPDTGLLDPEQVYERHWARTLLERALARLGEEAASEGHRDRFERLRLYLADGEDGGSYRQAADALGLSEGAVKTAVYRFRRRLVELVREEVEHTVVHPEEVDAELRHLLSSLAN